MRNATEAEINDVFGRINTYGHRLSDQERRQAGVQNAFSNMVREIACTLRGDVSSEILPLRSMPSISIDLPMTKHGYSVRASEVFWVNQGVLRSTDLRDSMDEQCIADIAVCLILGEIIERSKDQLDEVYTQTSAISDRLLTALELYGSERFAEEFKYCVDRISDVCRSEPAESTHLRDLLFKKQTSNAFPSVFAVLMIAFHELIVKESKQITDCASVRGCLADLSSRIDTSRKATSPEERRKNVDVVKGLIGNLFIQSQNSAMIYGNHAVSDIEAMIRRSEIELADYELKQGYLSLSAKRQVDNALIDKIMKTICAIANNGPGRMGKIITGVTDKEDDAQKVARLDKIEPRKVGKRFVVGVAREALLLEMTMEGYFSQWKNALRKSALSQHLKEAVLSNVDFNNFYGLGVIIITIPPQKELSYFAEKLYWRDADSTLRADAPKQIATLAQRF